MRIGGAILLLAVGAILTFAISVDNSHGFNINTVGVILMVAGILWLIAEVAVYGRRRRDVVTTQPPVQTTEYRY
jgi:uncharacterized membrane protein YhaH (DUF805 family)